MTARFTRKLARAAGLAATLLGTPANGGAQQPGETDRLDRAVQERFERVAPSIVRIRTDVEFERRNVDPGVAGRFLLSNPLVMQGTGIVIGTVFEGGRKEYVVLTSDHVVDSARYLDEVLATLQRGRATRARSLPRAEREESFLAASAEADPASDIRLVVIARDLPGDMALLRTVGGPDSLSIYPDRIGFVEGEVGIGAPLITAGFPLDEPMLTARGVLTGLQYHALGGPHLDYVVDLPLKPGQSGSPVFQVRVEGTPTQPAVAFTLVGLLHAREQGVPLMVPYTVWSKALCETPFGNHADVPCPRNASVPWNAVPGSARAAPP